MRLNKSFKNKAILSYSIVGNPGKIYTRLYNLMSRFFPFVEFKGFYRTVQEAGSTKQADAEQLMFIHISDTNDFLKCHYGNKKNKIVLIVSTAVINSRLLEKLSATDLIIDGLLLENFSDGELLHLSTRTVISTLMNRIGLFEMNQQLMRLDEITNDCFIIETGCLDLFISKSQIVYVKVADTFLLIKIFGSPQIMLVSEKARSYELLFSSFGFFRVDEQCLINEKYIRCKSESGKIVLMNDMELTVSNNISYVEQ